MKRVLSILAVIPLLAACSGAPAMSPTPEAPAVTTARGSIDVEHLMISGAEGDACRTDGGYVDIAEGTQVKVLDADGKVLSFGTLGAGRAVDNFPTVRGTDACRFPFAVADVPTGHSIYGVEVAKRGVIQAKEADLGAVPLKLG